MQTIRDVALNVDAAQTEIMSGNFNLYSPGTLAMSYLMLDEPGEPEEALRAMEYLHDFYTSLNSRPLGERVDSLYMSTRAADHRERFGSHYDLVLDFFIGLNLLGSVRTSVTPVQEEAPDVWELLHYSTYVNKQLFDNIAETVIMSSGRTRLHGIEGAALGFHQPRRRFGFR